MIHASARRAQKPLKYSVRLPWIGPILGPRASRNAAVQIGAAADPLLGKALAAVFVPVERGSKRLVPITPDGKQGTVDEVGWIDRPKSDREGRFRIEVPRPCWSAHVKSVLMLLVYDLSGRVAAEDWPVYLGNLLHREKGSASALARGAGTISELPARERDEIRKRIEDLLLQPVLDLEEGLIELEWGAQAAAAGAEEITFALASCQYPPGFVDGDVAESSYRRLNKYLNAASAAWRPQCLLLVGDQIYVDATAGMFDPLAKSDRFELPHERLLRMKPLRHILRRIPAYMMLDDHEIEDNWEPARGEGGDDPNLADGRHYYLKYQRMAGPVPISAEGDSREPLWYPFEVDRIPFFMADTRTERMPRTVRTIESACIMRPTQFGALLKWLDAYKKSNVPKFVASPACFLPRHARAKQNDCMASALRSDAWDGYPGSFHPLLAYIAEHEIRNVVFLSGDEHISFVTCAAITAKGSGKSTCIASVHSSALYAPYPFANAIENYLVGKECFGFEVGGDKYSCEVTSTTFAPAGDGFTLLSARKDKKDQWKVTCRFSREAGLSDEIPVLG